MFWETAWKKARALGKSQTATPITINFNQRKYTENCHVFTKFEEIIPRDDFGRF